MFAEVSLPISSFQTFTYAVPENLKKEAIVSVRVEVPFGNRNCLLYTSPSPRD